MNINKSALKAEFEIKTIEGQIKNLYKLIFGQAAGSEMGASELPSHTHNLLKDMLSALSHRLYAAKRKRSNLNALNPLPVFEPAYAMA
ncbi:MAG: hypothetical protein JKY71_06695 [Alphaproteobacteria bacterium]|nr:hypothetical protein [Alphaproteobacteria bacterium]